jgi:1-acyl-sn-glycerol-3-phosphate acyltransferase
MSCLRFFYVNHFIEKVNKDTMHTKVLGQEYLKNIHSGIVTCNHVFIFDCLAAKKALTGKNLYITAAPFNNQKKFFGSLMRAGGMMPFSPNPHAMRNFNKAIEYYLFNGDFILFYPEQAMWWLYEKPRPFKNGAFHYAVKHNVPIIPLFITFTPRTIYKTTNDLPKDFTVHIMPPIYSKKEFSKIENIAYLKETNFLLCKEKYEEVYKKTLKYTCNADK